ncbi:unnamed protein product [Caenorhabditis bovis]|uniref:Delta(3,5)-Delta(2,4)-dienoyl-CoA isomerase, mitochondrial n=1 Tax=Caenorhabditis bovis TaxID=2654633 RepID=A0A8S1ETT4_9PELO|nr:unnamed protein product [Caenorhabditis bovis]
MVYSAFKYLDVENLGDYVYRVSLNRPDKYNALNFEFWREIGLVFKQFDEDENCRVVILEGNGKHFCAGLDLMAASQIGASDDDDGARKARKLLREIQRMQQDFTNVQKCLKPVLVGMHGFSLGAAIDLASACDVRYATRDAVLSVKEVDIGMAADIGSLNRLPKIVGNMSWIKEISMTARHFSADEAKEYGLVSKVFETRDEMRQGLLELAKLLATKSPVAVQGTKGVLNYSMDHSIEDSLNYVATWNMSQLATDDVQLSALASLTKQPLPPFSKL